MGAWPTAGMTARSRSTSFGSSQTTSSKGRSCGKRCARSGRGSPARNFFGGITCMRAPTGRSPRGRCIPPMAARSSTFTRTRWGCAMRSKKTSDRFRFRHFGVRWRASRRRSGSRARPNGWRRKASPTCRSFTCRTSITIFSGSGRMIRGWRPTIVRLTAWRAG